MLLLQATRKSDIPHWEAMALKDFDAAIAIFKNLGSRHELGGMSVVVQASRLHIIGYRLATEFVRARRPHHNPLLNVLSFVGHASRVPGVRAAFPSSVIPSEAVSFLSFRPSEPSERVEESVASGQ